jgi:hypothetical protein
MQSDCDQFFPDEGLPALAIFTFHYRSEAWLRSKGYIKVDQKQRRSHKAKPDHKEKETYLIDGSDNILNSTLSEVLGDPEKLEIRVNFGPVNRRRVPVFIYDIHGTLIKKMALNIDRNDDVSKLYLSFQRILRFIQHDYVQQSNQQIEAVTDDGTHHRDLTNLDFDAVKGFYII